MGEIRTIGTRPEGAPWRVGLADPVRPGVLTETVDLIGRAVATSAGAEFRFDPKDRFTHLFDPVTGRSPSLYSTVSVIAPTATEADALSTAFSLRPLPRIRGVVAVRPNRAGPHHRGRRDFNHKRCVRKAGVPAQESNRPSTLTNEEVRSERGHPQQENIMRGFIFVGLLAMVATGEVRAQDAAAGEKVFGVCKMCHQIGEGAKNAVGPILNGVIGRKAGSVAGL